MNIEKPYNYEQKSTLQTAFVLMLNTSPNARSTRCWTILSIAHIQRIFLKIYFYTEKNWTRFKNRLPLLSERKFRSAKSSSQTRFGKSKQIDTRILFDIFLCARAKLYSVFAAVWSEFYVHLLKYSLFVLFILLHKHLNISWSHNPWYSVYVSNISNIKTWVPLCAISLRFTTIKYDLNSMKTPIEMDENVNEEKSKHSIYTLCGIAALSCRIHVVQLFNNNHWLYHCVRRSVSK